MKKWQEFLIWIIYFILVDVCFDFIQYFLDYSVFNRWYFFIVGFALLSLGWLGCWLDSKLGTIKKLNKNLKLRKKCVKK